MKKIIISFTLIIVQIFGNLPFVFAEGTASYIVEANAEGDGFVVSGEVVGARGNVLLTLVVEKQSGEFLVGGQTIAKRNDDGSIVFCFDEVKFPYTAATGVYTFTVTGDGFSAPAQVPTCKYISVEDKRQLLADVNDLAEAGGSGLYEKLASYAELFGAASADAAKLSEDKTAKRAFDNCLKTKTYDVPDAADSREKILQITESYAELAEYAEEALAVGLFAHIGDADMAEEWILRYYAVFGFDRDDNATAEDETAITVYVNDVKKTQTFAARIAACNDVDSTEAVRDKIYECALLSAIETMHFSSTYSIIEAFPSLFKINTDNFRKLSEEEQGEIYAQIANEYYETYFELITSFNAAVKNALKADDSSGKGNGSSGGWSGGGGGGVSVNKKADTSLPQESTEKGGFKDLADVEWAKEAVLYLSEKGIINGKAQGVFAPNDFITRAEFIKIFVGAIGLEIKPGDKSSFVDVPANEWYAPYVAAAERNKLITGNEDNLFMPDRNITRQDAAVILYRAFSPAAKNEPIQFKDSTSISDYAAESVASLTAAEIINGMGNGNFEPLTGATRAQAAVMIYKLIK